MLDKPNSFNNKLILEAYKTDGALRQEVRSGWSMVGQKNYVKGLKVLVQATLSDGTVVPAGSTAYIKEELLSTQPWAKNKLRSDTLTCEFIIVTMNEVEYLSPPGDSAA